MTDVIVTFKEDVSNERRDALLAQVQQWPGVIAAAPLQQNAPKGFERFSYVRVEGDKAEQVAKALNDLSEIEEAEPAPQRGMY